ncbi:MAG: DUF6345 domain-containing protein [Candidatus Baldrarchaeia archaeon]
MENKRADLDLTILCIVLVFSLIFISISVNIAHASPGDDANEKEIGIEWVNNYHGVLGLSNLSHCDKDAEGFLNYLVSKGFTRNFRYFDDSAWEKDFEKPSVLGWDWVDKYADFVYFSGHGSDEPAFYFGTNHDGDGFYKYRCHHSEAEWGDEDLEWIFISACLCLRQGWFNTIVSRWKSAFNDLHGMTGFHTTEPDTPNLGEIFAKYLTDWGPYPIGEAWKKATIRELRKYGRGIYAAVYRIVIYKWEDLLGGGGTRKQVYDYWYDYLPGYGTGIEKDPSEWGDYPYESGFRYSKWECY